MWAHQFVLREKWNSYGVCVCVRLMRACLCSFSPSSSYFIGFVKYVHILYAGRPMAVGFFCPPLFAVPYPFIHVTLRRFALLHTKLNAFITIVLSFVVYRAWFHLNIEQVDASAQLKDRQRTLCALYSNTMLVSNWKLNDPHCCACSSRIDASSAHARTRSHSHRIKQPHPIRVIACVHHKSFSIKTDIY